MAIDPTAVLNRVLDDDLVRQLLRETGPATLFENEDDTFYELQDHGLSLLTDNRRRIRTIHYFLTPVEEYKPFTGTLPHGLTVRLSRHEVMARLGVPARKGEARPGAHWIRYDHPTHSLHVQFSEDDRPELVTLMTPDAVP